MFRSVAGGEDGFELDVAHFENVAVMEEAGVGISPRPLELPVRPALGGKVGDGSVALGELSRAA